jgi:hypothetical protein
VAAVQQQQLAPGRAALDHLAEEVAGHRRGQRIALAGVAYRQEQLVVGLAAEGA